MNIELISRVYPPEDHLLVERLEMPSRRGLIILPFATREYNRAAEAVIRVSRCPEWEVDSKVILSGSVSRSVTFGQGVSERTLWLCSPSQILAKVVAFPKRMIEMGQEGTLRNYTSEDMDTFVEAGDKFDEGDPQGLR